MNYASLMQQGDSLTGYEENGPYHCGDCVHRLNKSSDVCVHPFIKANPKLANRRVVEHGKVIGVKVNLKRGCCAYVKQPKKDEDDGKSRVS